MRIVLIGYGRMGREIEQTAINRGHTISRIIDIHNSKDLNASIISDSDVAIEFTTPSSVIDNLEKCFELKLPVVTGTTGWHDQLQRIIQKCKKEDHSLFYASNFSIGVNLFFTLNEKLAEMMEKFSDYDVSIQETHHTKKLDTPSGTAVSLAQIILEKLSGKDNWTLNEAASHEIPIKAIREGDVTGIHKVKYDSKTDFIEVIHNAKSREGFAKGAVLASEYLYGKKGVFTMRDLLGI